MGLALRVEHSANNPTSEEEVKLLYLDTETTGLRLEHHEVWEIAILLAETDDPAEDPHVYHYIVEPTWLEQADPGALRVNHYYSRTRGLDRGEGLVDRTARTFSDPYETARDVAWLCEDAILVGNNPAFDEMFLAKFCQGQSQMLAPFHRKINVADLALGYLLSRLAHGSDDLNEVVAWRNAVRLPHSPRALLDAAGCPPNKSPHTALGDAMHVRDAYLHLTGVTR
jgi:hypothetical protein